MADFDPTKHDMEGSESKSFDRKVYMMPESYNALRREMQQNYPTLWEGVGWFMAFDFGGRFVELMDAACDTKTLVMGTDYVDNMCKRWLNALRQKRGVSKL